MSAFQICPLYTVRLSDLDNSPPGELFLIVLPCARQVCAVSQVNRVAKLHGSHRTPGSISRRRLRARARAHAISWASRGSGRIADQAPSSAAACAGNCARPGPLLAAPASARCRRAWSSLGASVAESRKAGAVAAERNKQRRPLRAVRSWRELVQRSAGPADGTGAPLIACAGVVPGGGARERW
jgi:hypothetical protein